MNIINNYLISDLCEIVRKYLIISKNRVQYNKNDMLDEYETFIYHCDCIHKPYKPSLIKMDIDNISDVDLETEYNNYLINITELKS
jgi:hypothetical protein